MRHEPARLVGYPTSHSCGRDPCAPGRWVQRSKNSLSISCKLTATPPLSCVLPAQRHRPSDSPCPAPLLQAWRASTGQRVPARSSCVAACGTWWCLLGTAPAWPPLWRCTRPSCCLRTRLQRWGPPAGSVGCAGGPLPGASHSHCGAHLVLANGSYHPHPAAPWALQADLQGRGWAMHRTRPAQVSGPPGDAFELVYGGVTDRVRANMHTADPALGEWIRWGRGAVGQRAVRRCPRESRTGVQAAYSLPQHAPVAASCVTATLAFGQPPRSRWIQLCTPSISHPARPLAPLLSGLPGRLHLYGDIYSSPGLDMQRKQLLTCAFLSEAGMPDQLFGHALAALRRAPLRGEGGGGGEGPKTQAHPEPARHGARGRCRPMLGAPCTARTWPGGVVTCSWYASASSSHQLQSTLCSNLFAGLATAMQPWRRRRGWPATSGRARRRAAAPCSKRRCARWAW